MYGQTFDGNALKTSQTSNVSMSLEKCVISSISCECHETTAENLIFPIEMKVKIVINCSAPFLDQNVAIQRVSFDIFKRKKHMNNKRHVTLKWILNCLPKLNIALSCCYDYSR